MGFPTFKICPPGMPMYLPVSVLVLQTAVPLLIRLSRKYRPAGSGSSYLPASITLLAEALKCLVAFAFMARARGRRMRGHRRSTLPWGEVVLATAKRFREAVVELSSLMLPAMLYFASNVTAVYALSHVRSYMFTAIMNARIVFAALLSLAVLDKHASTEQWRAILIIFCAATVLCLEDVQVKEDFTVSEETVGVFISLGTAAVSAAGGVFMEKYLLSAALQPRTQAGEGCGDTGGSSSDPEGPAGGGSDVWEQQCVLALFSAAFAALYVAIFHLPSLLHGDLLRGWTIITVTIVAMQATQGVLVAFTIARCGIVFRLILGTLSICLCILVEGLAFREPVLAREVLTIAMVIIGSNLYATSSTSTAGPTAIKPPPIASITEEDSLPIITTEDAWPGSNKTLQADKTKTSDGWSHSVMGGTPSKELAYPAPLRALAGLHKAGSGSGATGSAQGSMLRRVSLLLVVTIVYISFSSSFSVMLASRTRKVDNAQAAFLQPAVLAMSDLSEVERKAQALRLRQQGRQAGEGSTAGSTGGGKAATEGTALLGGDEVDDVDLPKPAIKADKADTDRLRESLLSEVLQGMAESDSSILQAAAVALRYQHGEKKCRVEDYFEERPWDPQAPMPVSKGGRGGGKRDVAVCVQIKNDAAVLDEYITFHWVQGVGRFIIYDDDSSDDPWSVLQKYVALGIVEYHDLKGHSGSGGNELQTNNYNECFASIREHAHESGLRWILFPDIDEFFLPHDSTSTLSQTLNKHFDHSPCLEVARTYFGSSFQHRRPTGLVVENYVLASPVGADGFPKMVANVHPTGGQRNATALFTVHNIVDQADIPCTWMAESSQHIRIHHYVRSLQDYETKVLTGHKALNRYTKPLELWWERDRNERLDTTAADYGCRVRAAMAQLDSIKASLPDVERPPSPYISTLLTGLATTHGEEVMIGVSLN